MPRGNGTGPMGMGPMTGRGAGYCAGLTAPGHANPVGFARGFGCGFDRSRGFRRMCYATGVPGWARNGYVADAGANTAAYDEKAVLKDQAEYLGNQLQQIKKRLSILNDEEE